MFHTIKAEFRKLLTIRSTHIMIILSLLLTILFAFYFEGYRGNTGSPASTLQPGALNEIVKNAAGFGVVFLGIISILFMAHEYRYNTIMYTLTANARRSRVLFAKVLTISVFGVCYGALIGLVAAGSYMVGLSLRDASLPPQDFEVLSQVGKQVVYYIGYGLVGLILASLTRSVVMAVATFFIFPTMIEGLLSIVLKDNSKYLPFTALDGTVGASMMPSVLSSAAAMAVTGIYLGVGLFVTWLLFVRRDAN